MSCSAIQTIFSSVNVNASQASDGIATPRDVKLVSSKAVVFAILQGQDVMNAKKDIKRAAIYAFAFAINTASNVLKSKTPMHVRNVKKEHIYIKVHVILYALLGLLRMRQGGYVKIVILHAQHV